jgi:hypothetical protein
VDYSIIPLDSIGNLVPEITRLGSNECTYRALRSPPRLRDFEWDTKGRWDALQTMTISQNEI